MAVKPDTLHTTADVVDVSVEIDPTKLTSKRFLFVSDAFLYASGDEEWLLTHARLCIARSSAARSYSKHRHHHCPLTPTWERASMQ